MTFERYPELDTLLLANPGAVRDYKPEGGLGSLYGGRQNVRRTADYGRRLCPGIPKPSDADGESRTGGGKLPAATVPGYPAWVLHEQAALDQRAAGWGRAAGRGHAPVQKRVCTDFCLADKENAERNFWGIGKARRRKTSGADLVYTILYTRHPSFSYQIGYRAAYQLSSASANLP